MYSLSIAEAVFPILQHILKRKAYIFNTVIFHVRGTFYSSIINDKLAKCVMRNWEESIYDKFFLLCFPIFFINLIHNFLENFERIFFLHYLRFPPCVNAFLLHSWILSRLMKDWVKLYQTETTVAILLFLWYLCNKYHSFRLCNKEIWTFKNKEVISYNFPN